MSENMVHAPSRVAADIARMDDRAIEDACEAFYGHVWFSGPRDEFTKHKERLRRAMRRAIAAALRSSEAQTTDEGRRENPENNGVAA